MIIKTKEKYFFGSKGNLKMGKRAQSDKMDWKK